MTVDPVAEVVSGTTLAPDDSLVEAANLLAYLVGDTSVPVSDTLGGALGPVTNLVADTTVQSDALGDVVSSAAPMSDTVATGPVDPVADLVSGTTAPLSDSLGGAVDPVAEVVSGTTLAPDDSLVEAANLLAYLVGDTSVPVSDTLGGALDPVTNPVADTTVPLSGALDPVTNVVADTALPLTDALTTSTGPLTATVDATVSPLTDALSSATGPLTTTVDATVFPLSGALTPASGPLTTTVDATSGTAGPGGRGFAANAGDVRDARREADGHGRAPPVRQDRAGHPDREARRRLAGMRHEGKGSSRGRERVPLKHSARISRALIVATGRVVVVWLAVAMIASAHRPLDAGGLMGVSVAAAIWIVALRAASAGAPYVLGRWVPAAIGSTTGLVCVAAVNPHLPGLQLSLGTELGMWVGIFFSSATWEGVLERTAKRRVLVVGTSAVADLEAAARRGRRMPFEIVPADELLEGAERPAESLNPIDLAPIVAAHRPDLIVLADEQSCSHDLERLLDVTDRRFRVAGLTSFYEYAFGCVPLPGLTPLWFMSLLHIRQPAHRRPSKRLFDVVVAVVGLAFTALLLPLFALVIKRTPGPVIYRQTRVGEGGRRFTMYKLRTMTASAEAAGAVFAQASDPRATRSGRFLRKTHLDELPQLWNVLKGEMSIVGPRPERPEFIAMLEEGVPFWSRRLLMKPGMTGWAQVRCGYASDHATAAEKLSYDFWYMRHGNLAVDVAVCLRTGWLALDIIRSRRVWPRPRARREHALR